MTDEEKKDYELQRKKNKIRPFVLEDELDEMAKPKYNYEADEWYEEIYNLAYQGMTNKEIAYALVDRFGVSLSPDRFSAMAKGTYEGWSAEDNAYRSTRICRALERARMKINAVVRNRYLKMALGGLKTKTVTTVSRRMRIDGELTDNEDIQTSVSEQEHAPSLQALSVWLHHYDPDWRKYEGVVHEDLKDDPNAIPEAKRGIDISQWIDKEVEEAEIIARITDADKLPPTEKIDTPTEDLNAETESL